MSNYMALWDINRRRHSTPVLLPGKSHGWRSLVGCSSWGCQESDVTEQLHFDFLLSCIGDGNGNWLQCSCLKNPRDRGAWWAAIYGVAQSQTRLKWLSSSSSEILICWCISIFEIFNQINFHRYRHRSEKEMATHSSVLAWKIPGTGEPDGLPSMGSHRVGHDWSNLAASAAA